jgi:hypothetical protein
MTLPTGLESACASKKRHSAVEIRGEKWDTKAERTVSAKEYRDNAVECMGWARTARSDRERAIFLQMADLDSGRCKGRRQARARQRTYHPRTVKVRTLY